MRRTSCSHVFEATMNVADTSKILLDGAQAVLDQWRAKPGADQDLLYWVLRLQLAEITGDDLLRVEQSVAEDVRDEVRGRREKVREYYDDVRYVALEPVVALWGTVVNSLRVAADTDRTTPVQKDVFAFSRDSVLAFFQAARERMAVADSLYHAYKAMPAPECQALAALLNIHVDARLDVDSMCRLVRLLDHEGPMSAEEQRTLSALTNTSLVDATFRGLRGHG
jgi:hypothetical protein